jgi:polynucleotide 5'-kinase involved in rRNA processing
VGPPTTIFLAILSEKWDFSKTRPVDLYFVGASSPLGRLLSMIVGTCRMVEGVGRALKACQIESIRPDAIVWIEHQDELGPLIRSQRTHNILRTGASPCAVSKSRKEHIAARQRSFKAESVSLFTPAAAEKISVIQGGDLYLDRHGNERRRASWTTG